MRRRSAAIPTSGLQGDAAEASKAPLPVIEVDDLEAALKAVEAAGGRIVRPIFTFPGGRRFHAADPSGNEIACPKSTEATCIFPGRHPFSAAAF
jgi:predicted enzyme related to lactoylglutathione lyase